jgi:hypothetical protein
MLGIHVIIFLGAFLIAKYIIMQFVIDPTFWTTIIPIAFAWLIAPRPHAVQMQSGKEYGLKSILSKKVFKINHFLMPPHIIATSSWPSEQCSEYFWTKCWSLVDKGVESRGQVSGDL